MSVPPSICPAFVFSSSICMSYFCLLLIHPYDLFLSSTHSSLYVLLLFSAHPSVCPALVFRSSIVMSYFCLRSSVHMSCFCLPLIRQYILLLSSAHPFVHPAFVFRSSSVYPVFVFRSSIHMSYFCLPLIHLSNPNPFGTEEFVQLRHVWFTQVQIT